MEKNEIWKEIIDFEKYYEISNLGNVRSLYRKEFLLIKKILSNTGYFVVRLNKNGKSEYKTIHKLVAESFLNHKPCGYKLVINHIDGNKTNNCVDNLEIVTNRYNTADGINRTKKTSIFHGVFLNKKTNKWMSSIQVDKKNYHLGCYITEIDASKIYNDAIFNIKNNNFDIWYKSLKTNIKKTSKYKGVSWCVKMNKWKSRIEKNGTTKHLGYFINEEDAFLVYEKEKNHS